jgi:hypothetical protein
LFRMKPFLQKAEAAAYEAGIANGKKLGDVNL